MKRIIIFVIVGLVMFGAGFGGGMVLGRSMSPGEGEGGASNARVVPEPGPIVSIGDFSGVLAGGGNHSFTIALSMELVSREEAVAIVQAPGWFARIRNEVNLLLKDRTYNDMNSAEGALQFAGDIKRVLNALLPDVKGEAPIAQILFDSFTVL
ncbi:MAG: flagellar basal body-associated FliL family protein [Fretibacterium sp.]|nr:flagellar basal body-associated FliL family protein [Fretibacterium sp.]